MKLIVEPGDFGPHSGKNVEDLADPVYGFSVLLFKEPGRAAFAKIKHHGSGFLVEPDRLTVEIAGVELGGSPHPLGVPGDRAFSVAVEPESEKPAKARKSKEGKNAEPPLTGPRLPESF